ncbi:MAG: HIRAN domain-containing protein [Candidatus Rokuibacteriota bacterium]
MIALCQTVTEDGRLVDQEIAALRQWLEENRGSDLPAVAFLVVTVERILADGKVTTEEQQDLYRAIETVLPPDIRVSVRGTRLSGEHAAKEEARLWKEAAEQAESEAGARNLPVDSWDFMVAGVRYEGRPEVIRQFAETGDTAFLIRDRANAYSRNAVEVRLSNGMQAGYVPEQHAVDVAPLLDSGHKHGAYMKKILTGGRAPIPVVVASLYPPEADRPDAVSEQQVPAAQKPLLFAAAGGSAAAKRGCLVLLALLGGLVYGVAWAIAR